LEPIKNRFKSSNGVRYTKGLFLEESYEDRSSVLYTLKNEDHEGYASLYRRYMDFRDPTEVKFANAYFDGWEHWQMICNSSWFKPYIKRWREELELHIRAEALSNILATSKDTDSKFFYEANKFILSGNWKPKPDKDAVGRPSKESIREKAEELFMSAQQTDEDYKRLKLNG
jgi:hypothetical protein